MTINDGLSKLAASKFRSRFHLTQALRDYVAEKGMETVRSHARDIIRQNLVPATPHNDGRQTPMKGHPVFIAQHATATCCRGCLNKWWHVPLNVELSAEQQEKIVNLIVSWIDRDMFFQKGDLQEMKKVEFGVCASPVQSKAFADAGYDYIEGTVYGDLAPLSSDLEFQEKYDAIMNSALPMKCANCFLPSTLKVTGPKADLKQLTDYAEAAFSRAKSVGIETIVFGSGGARQVPEGFPEEEAAGQVFEFTKALGPLAKKYGVTLVIEPLCDCNILSSVAEGAALVNRIKNPNIRLLADFYHWDNVCDSNIAALCWSVPLLRHIHVATTPSRCQPGIEDCRLQTFFHILKSGGYKGRISFEGHWKETPDKERECLQAMKSLWVG